MSLILVTYNAERLLPAFFDALKQTTYSPFEVIVVDNGSSDRTLDIVEQDWPSATLIRNKKSRGFANGCHQGAEIARGGFLVFLNPDIIVTPNWLETLVEHISQEPEAAIIAPQSHPPGKLLPDSATPFKEADAVPGCAMLVRRAAWESLGGFDRRFFLYWEDTEFCWRAWLGGWRVLEDLQAHVYHDEGTGGGGRRWADEQIKNGLLTYLKLMRWRKVLPFAAILLAKTIVRSATMRRTDLTRAWIWNARNVSDVMAERRAIARVRRGSILRLERLIDDTRRRRRLGRLEEWWSRHGARISRRV